MKQRTFLISDTHFSHKNILKYEDRPFKNTHEMDEHMIEQWNNIVTENDLVIHVGDVVIAGAKRAEEVLNRLNGRKILVLGNHDHFTKTKWRKFGFDPHDYYFYKDYLITHFPTDEAPLKVAVGEGLIKGNIHGHTHSKIDNLDQSIYHCCCVELIEYKPILFEEFVGKKRQKNIFGSDWFQI